MTTMTKAKISVDAIKSLRDKTGAPLGEVRAALEVSGGSEPKALEWLKARGVQVAEKRQGRATGQGRIEAYIHHDGKLGALVEVACETDFVARTADFTQFAKDLALHVAAMAPKYVKAEDAPAGISQDDLKAWVLLEQPFVKDAGITVGDLLKALIAKTGENVVIRRVVKFGIGGE
jgi:elongation factor Ts